MVQIYFSRLKPTESSPLQSLMAFKSVSIKKGEPKTVDLEIPVSSRRHFDAKSNQYVVDKGIYNFLIGASSKDIRKAVSVFVN